ncbi:hypothetical protein [Paenibacillus sp. KS1]|uniref:hypothetical protein n=1 Tax=Paenibacillus sp. KS1 TaxID=1849249 RepID=UPI001586BA75|nr:hypothetical protein [Paenibacillus sp. KS1]
MIRRLKFEGKRNRYLLNNLDNVPCIALSEATYYFKKLAEEQGVEVWGTIRKVIKSEQYSNFKDSFTSETVKEYLRFLQERVKIEKGDVVEIAEIKEKEKKLPF